MPQIRPSTGTGPLPEPRISRSGNPSSIQFPGVQTQNYTPVDKTFVAQPAGQSLLNLNWLDSQPEKPPIARLKADFELEDIDGIDQSSREDLRGKMNVDLKLERRLFDQAVAEMNSSQKDLKFSLNFDRQVKAYKITVGYKSFLGTVNFANLTLKPMSNGRLKAEIGGLAGGAANLINGLSFGYAEKKVDELIQNISKNMGFKVASSSLTEYVLEPDLQNSPLFQEMAIGGGETIKLESVSTPQGALLDLSADAQGNFSLRMQNVNVTASSKSGVARAVADREGSDRISLEAQALVYNDYSSEIQTETDLNLNVQASETQGLRQRLKNLSGQDLPMSGQIQIEDLKVKTELNANRRPVSVEAESGTLSARSLNLQMGSTELALAKADGQLQLEREGQQTTLKGQDISLQGSVSHGGGQFQFSDLRLSGELTHDEKRPQQVHFEMGAGQSLNFSGSVSQQGQSVNVQGLQLKSASLDADLASGALKVNAVQGQTPDLRVRRLSLQGAQLSGLNVTGTLDANTQTGQTRLNGSSVQLQSFKMADIDVKNIRVRGSVEANTQSGKLQLNGRSISLNGSFPGVDLSRFQGSGQLNFDPATGLSLRDSRFDLAGTAQGMGITGLKGQGDLDVSLTGQLELKAVRGLELETDQGLKLKGDFKGQISPQGYTLETLGNKPARVDFQQPEYQIDLQNLQVVGRAQMDAGAQNITFSGTDDQGLKLSSGRIGDLTLKDVHLDGSLSYGNNQLQFTPQNGELNASGQVGEVQIKSLQTNAPARFDLGSQVLTWDGQTQASMPAHGIDNLRTDGPMQVEFRRNGEVVFSTQGSTLNATLGQLQLTDLKTDGKVVFQPATGEIRFEGPNGQGLKATGQFNGRPLDLESSGSLKIQDSGDSYRIAGENIKVKGLLDGFTLDSPKGVEGAISMKRDFSQFELNDLNFGFQVDDIAVNNQNGTVRSTPEGLEIKLQGALGANKQHLQALLQKLAGRSDFGADFQQGLRQVEQGLDAAFTEFENADLNYENLTLVIDPQQGLKRFTVENRSQLKDARMEVEINGKQKVLPMGDLQWDAQVEGKPGEVRVPEGQVRFSLTEDLRESLAKEVEQQLEDSGLKDVDLEILPNGKVMVHNATVQRNKLKLSAELDISTRIVDNRLEVSMDRLKLKNFLFDIVGKVIGASDKVNDQVDAMLEQQKVKYERRNRKGRPDPESGRVFSLDLQALMQRIDPGIQLKSASLNEQGQIVVDYGFERKFSQ